MKYASLLLAALLMAGSLAVPSLYADAGADHSEPPAVEDEAIVLADSGGDLGGQPAEERMDEIRLADSGGDRGEQPVDEAQDIELV
jgi:hypothetical protein